MPRHVSIETEGWLHPLMTEVVELLERYKKDHGFPPYLADAIIRAVWNLAREYGVKLRF